MFLKLSRKCLGASNQLTKQSTENSLIHKILIRLLRLEFKSSNMLKSKAVKYTVTKILPDYYETTYHKYIRDNIFMRLYQKSICDNISMLQNILFRSTSVVQKSTAKKIPSVKKTKTMINICMKLCRF